MNILKTNNPLIVILGPTATGKTRIAKLISKKIECAIINCDAYQIYKELNIGVNKSSFNNNIKNYLFNIISINDPYSIKLFQKDSREAINNCFSSGKTPILVGGSTLYALSCVKNYEFIQKRKSASYLDKLSNKELHDILKNLDINESKKIHMNNRRRVLRAIEIYKETSINKTSFNSRQSNSNYFSNTYIFIINRPKEELMNDINNRVEKQFEEGLLEEVIELSKNYATNLNALQAIGYKEIISSFETNEEISLIKEKIKTNTRRYAKKQLTFLKKIEKAI